MSSRRFLVVALLFLQVVCFTAAQDEASTVVLLGPESPEHQLVYAPLGSTRQFSCTGLHAGENNAWFIKPADSATTLQFGGLFQSDLNERQINRTVIVHSGSNATSIVTVKALERNDGIELKCQFRDSMTTRVVAYLATLLVYDRPMAPSDLLVNTVGVQSVNISWNSTQVYPDEVDVNFTLTVENLNTSNKQTVPINKSYYVYNAVANVPLCSVYMMFVTATNDAGTSDPSDTVITMLPSLPDMKPVSDSLTHTISKIEKQISMNIAFDAANDCTEYPVTHYHILASTSPNESPIVIATGNASDVKADNGIEFQLPDSVQENILYMYYVVATNEIGNVSSVVKECYTSDIDTVRAAEEGENNTLFVECTFIQGSNARGCQVVLISNSKNSSVMIYRDNANDSVASKVLSLEDGICYHSILGFDIEEDNNVSSLGVPGNLSVGREMCGVLTAAPPSLPIKPSSRRPLSTIAIICFAIVAGVLVLMVCALVTAILIACCYRRTKSKGSWDVRVSENQAYKEYRNTYGVIASLSPTSSNSSPPPCLDSPSSSVELSPGFQRQETVETCVDNSSLLNEPQGSDSPDSHVKIDSTVQLLTDSSVSACHSQSTNSQQSTGSHEDCDESAVKDSTADTQPPLYAELTEFTGARSSRLRSQTPPPIRRSLSMRASVPSSFHPDDFSSHSHDHSPCSHDDPHSQEAVTNVYDMPDSIRPKVHQDTNYNLLDHKIGDRTSSVMETTTEATYSELAEATDSGGSRGHSPSSLSHRNSVLTTGRTSSLSTHQNEMYSQLNQTPVYAVLENSSSPEPPPPLPPPLNSSSLVTSPLPTTTEHTSSSDAPPLYSEINDFPTSPSSTVDAYGYTDAFNNGIPTAGTDIF